MQILFSKQSLKVSIVGIIFLFLASPIFAYSEIIGEYPENILDSKIIFEEDAPPPFEEFTLKNFLGLFSDNGFLSNAYDCESVYYPDEGFVVFLIPKDFDVSTQGFHFIEIDSNYIGLAAHYDFDSDEETSDPLGILFSFSFLFMEGVASQ